MCEGSRHLLDITQGTRGCCVQCGVSVGDMLAEYEDTGFLIKYQSDDWVELTPMGEEVTPWTAQWWTYIE